MKAKHCRKRFFWLALIFLFAIQVVGAQTITGVVTDEMDLPLPGVNVTIVGTAMGTITDIDGNYSIAVPNLNSEISFSYIGYKNVTVSLRGSTILDVKLILDSELLEDVVVIGYGSIKKENLSGSVAVVTDKDLTRTPIPTFGKALQGKASGVVVMQDGSPGGSVNIRVRGIGSITQDPDPLIVIDGIIGGDLNSLSPQDIGSISVLKDASATAIYGANGANGVVLVTTKRGVSDKLSISISAYTGINTNPKKYNLMDADEYVNFYSGLYEADGVDVPLGYTEDFRQWYYGDGWNQGTDWQDEILQKSMMENYHLRISGGSKTARHSLSAGYYKESGILINTGSKRINLRTNSDYKIGKYIEVGESLTISRRENQNASGRSAWGMSVQSSPLMRVYNDDNKEGFEGSQISFDYVNPDGDSLLVLNTGGNDKFNPKGILTIPESLTSSDIATANVYVTIKPVEWLTFTSTPSINSYINEVNSWTPAYDMGVRSINNASLYHEFSKGNTYSLENKLDFNKSIGKHFISAVAVHHVRTGDYSNSVASAVGFPYEQLNIISQSDPDGRSVSGSSSDLGWAELSYLGRFIYEYDSKYLFTTSLRRDGSSNFGETYKWGNFPSFSAAWKIDRDFLQQIEQIDMLKLRVGWGMTGNSNVGRFGYQTSLASPNYFSPVFGLDQHKVLALNEYFSIGNPLIKWEAASMTNIGLDINAFNKRVQFSAEYYIKKQSDLLMTVPVSAIQGKFDDIYDTGVGAIYNIAEIDNRGFEFDIHYSKMEGEFNYRVFANLSTVKNSVEYLPSAIQSNDNITTIGHAIGSIYGYVAEGIIQESDYDEEGNYLYAKPAEGLPSPGDLRFSDLNNDGKITILDRTIIGKGIPDFTYSFGAEFYYRDFDCSIFLYGIQNAQIYNTHRRDMESFSSQDLDHNKSADWALNYYSDETPSTEYLRLDQENSNLNNRISTWWVEDASFLRIKDIQIGYAFPQSLMSKMNIASVRIYISGANLYSFTKYTGYDPESPLNSDAPTTPGVDANNYPMPRTVSAGVQIDF